MRPNLSCNQDLNSAENPASSFDTQFNTEQPHCNEVEDKDEEDMVEIEFELEERETYYEGKYFDTIPN